MKSHEFFKLIGRLGLIQLLPLLILQTALAGSATWNLDPVDNDWDNPANWTPSTVPNGPNDVATFAASSITSLKFSARSTQVAEIVFTPGASSFNITADAGLAHTSITLTISGRGITNNSGVTQSLTAGPTVVFDRGIINFRNSATAGNRTGLNALASTDEGSFPSSMINFYDTSSAGHASIYSDGARGQDESYGAEVNFYNNATAGNASCSVTGAFGCCYGREINFWNHSSAGNARFSVLGAEGCCFGGVVTFFDNSIGGTPQFAILSGGGTLVINSEVAVGSIAGTGGIGIGLGNLSVGANNLSSTFGGGISGSGSLIKIGSGTLTLKGVSYYPNDTFITEGTLLAANLTGSATGTGVVHVEGGTLGGSGIIAGAVTVGTNTGVQAFLAPSKGVQKPATLTIQSPITLNDDSTYIYKLDTKRVRADEVIANGVVIDSGAKFSLRPSGSNALTAGQVFTVVNNTSASPIAGTFHNLRDGQVIVVNGSNLQASYTSGDGNDLTLSVVP